jgi:hypothetical protein
VLWPNSAGLTRCPPPAPLRAPPRWYAPNGFLWSALRPVAISRGRLSAPWQSPVVGSSPRGNPPWQSPVDRSPPRGNPPWRGLRPVALPRGNPPWQSPAALRPRHCVLRRGGMLQTDSCGPLSAPWQSPVGGSPPRGNLPWSALRPVALPRGNPPWHARTPRVHVPWRPCPVVRSRDTLPCPAAHSRAPCHPLMDCSCGLALLPHSAPVAPRRVRCGVPCAARCGPVPTCRSAAVCSVGPCVVIHDGPTVGVCNGHTRVACS